jgi:hypothetical protein
VVLVHTAGYPESFEILPGASSQALGVRSLPGNLADLCLGSRPQRLSGARRRVGWLGICCGWGGVFGALSVCTSANCGSACLFYQGAAQDKFAFRHQIVQVRLWNLISSWHGAGRAHRNRPPCISEHPTTYTSTAWAPAANQWPLHLHALLYCLSRLSKARLNCCAAYKGGRAFSCLLCMYIRSIYLSCTSCSATSLSSNQVFTTTSIRALYEPTTFRTLLSQHGYGCSWWHSLAALPSPHFRSYQHRWASDSTMPCHEPRPRGLSLHHSLVQGPRIFICLCCFFSFSFSAGLFSGSPSPEVQDKAPTPRDSSVVAADFGLRHQRHDTTKSPPYPWQPPVGCLLACSRETRFFFRKIF